MEELIAAMKESLGTAFVLYFKTQAFHWNVEGPDFPNYHAMLGSQYADIHASIDDIAEQIRQLDAYAPATVERMIQLSRIQGEVGSRTPRDVFIALVNDHETMMAVLTNALALAERENRQGLMNYLAARIEAHSKHRWMLRATTKKVGAVSEEALRREA